MATAASSTAGSRRQVRVRAGKPEERDIISRIHFDAFGPGPMSALLNGPDGVTEDAIAGFAMGLFPEPGASASKGEGFVMLAELLPEGGDEGQAPEVVAFGKWTLFRKERAEEEWNVPEPPMSNEQLAGANAEVMDAFIGDMHRRRQALAKGEAHLHLGILACKTKYGRLGAGSALLRQGLEIADELGIAVRLEASPEGYRLYERFGFEPIAVQDLELTKRWGVAQAPGANWGQDNAVETCGPLAEGHYRSVFMRRPAKGER